MNKDIKQLIKIFESDRDLTGLLIKLEGGFLIEFDNNNIANLFDRDDMYSGVITNYLNELRDHEGIFIPVWEVIDLKIEGAPVKIEKNKLFKFVSFGYEE